MDLANGGDLLPLIANHLPKLKAHHCYQECETYTERDVAMIFRQLLQAIDHVHSFGIVHRDVKFDNLLFFVNEAESTSDGTDNSYLGAKILLVDFGLCWTSL